MLISRVSAVLALACLCFPTVAAADVTLDGVSVPGAVSSMTIEVDVTEFRDGGEPDQCPRLIAGCAHPQVSLATPKRVAVLDAQLTGAASAQFTVGVEDGRFFHNCVVKSLEAMGKRRYRYGLACEGVSGP
jgi:hypothetical protein